MSDDELDTIIRLIPRATDRQIKILERQLFIHKHLSPIKDIEEEEE